MPLRAPSVFAAALTVVLTVALSAPALAGTVSLSWNPADGDPAGYRVYYGTSSGNYTQSVDVGNVTSTTVGNLAECTTWYFAVKAYNGAGEESTNYSGELSGWPRPSIQSTSPASAEAGRRLVLTVSGFNFETGAIADFLDPALVVHGTTTIDCRTVQIDVTVGAAAAAGPRDLDVTNPNQVYGVGSSVFVVDPVTAPSVSSTSPADGATGVGVTTTPIVQFSEPMAASSVSAGTVRLLDDASQPVAQAAGSPSLSADGRTATIVPAADLLTGATYRIEVLGGPSGVLDLAGHGMAADFRQTSGFTIDGDVDPPVIGGVSTEALGSTSTDIVWSTDEAADSEVEYRRAGQSTWVSSGVDPTLVGSHLMTLEGLWPDELYEYRVRSADAAGNTSVSAVQFFTTLDDGFSYLRFEAEFAEIDLPLREGRAPGAMLGGYLDTPPGTTGTPSVPAGLARFRFRTDAAGTWHVWARTFAPDASADRWLERMDNGGRQTMPTPSPGAWTWVAGRSYSLAAGDHVFELGGQDARARVDRVILTDDPTFRPTEAPEDDNAAPGPPTALNATPGNAEVLLDWTFPVDADVERVEVRYRTDGIFPTSIHDGADAGSAPGSAGVTGGLLHSGLTNGTRYLYGAFAVDASGHVSRVATTEATPTGDANVPGDVSGLIRIDRR